MKKNRITKVLAVAGATTLLALALCACSSSTSEDDDVLTSDTGLTGGVAATVNGTEIAEDKVTRSINNYRLNYGFDEESEWQEYFGTYSTTPECLRYQMLEQLVNRELILQCSDQLDVTTSDEEVQSYVDMMSSQYSSEEAWLEAVEEAGWDDEAAYRDALRYAIIQEKLSEHFQSEAEAALDDAALLAAVQDSAADYDGAKETACIVLDDEAQANEVLEQINSGTLTFAEAVAQYSTDETTKADGGNMGWDVTNSSLASAYTTAIADLEEGAVSAVTEVDGAYDIITVTDVWTAPETITSTSQLPDEFVEDIRTTTISSNAQANYSQWLIDLHSENDIQVNPMPENVPYNVDLSEYFTEDEIAEMNDAALYELINGEAKPAEETTEDETGEDTTADDSAEGEAGEDATAESGDTTNTEGETSTESTTSE